MIDNTILQGFECGLPGLMLRSEMAAGLGASGWTDLGDRIAFMVPEYERIPGCAPGILIKPSGKAV